MIESSKILNLSDSAGGWQGNSPINVEVIFEV